MKKSRANLLPSPVGFPPQTGVAFANVRGMLFPIIGFGERESEIRVNFGNSMFVYDIASHDWTTEESEIAIRIRQSRWMVV